MPLSTGAMSNSSILIILVGVRGETLLDPMFYLRFPGSPSGDYSLEVVKAIVMFSFLSSNFYFSETKKVTGSLEIEFSGDT